MIRAGGGDKSYMDESERVDIVTPGHPSAVMLCHVHLLSKHHSMDSMAELQTGQVYLWPVAHCNTL